MAPATTKKVDMAANNDSPKTPLRLWLVASGEAVKHGGAPKFVLTIHNEGDAPERIIDLSGGRRADLQDTYYDLVVTRNGKEVDVRRAISDPGPVGENDFLTLQPGEKVAFELTRFAAGLAALPPGEYQARIRFWQNPHQPATSAFFSPYAEFTVPK